MRGKSANLQKRTPVQTESTVNLLDLKRQTENLPSLRKSLTKIPILSQRQNKSRGQLKLGVINKATMVLRAQQRKNPWAKIKIVEDDLITRKGIFQLGNMGILPKNMDQQQLLNQRYSIPTVINCAPQQPAQTFLTNPAFLINTLVIDYYQAQKQEQKQEKQQEQIVQPKFRPLSKISRKTVITSDTGRFEPQQSQIQLTFVNGLIQDNQNFKIYSKRMRAIGMEHNLRHYISTVQQYLTRHRLKKVALTPTLNQTKKLTDGDILHSIINHKVLGIDLRVKGNPQIIFRSLVLMKVQRMRLRKLKNSMGMIVDLQRKYRVKRYYRKMIEKRWQYVNFKLGAFAEQQRKIIEEKESLVEVQIHLLASSTKADQISSYYKWNSRRNAQLTRLFNNQSDHIILLVPSDQNLDWWLDAVTAMPSNWKKPIIHIFRPCLQLQQLSQNAKIYFGLTKELVSSIKLICTDRKTIVVPFFIDQYVPKICETLSVPLFGGTYTKQSQNQLFSEEESNDNKGGKFTKLASTTQELNKAFSLKVKSLRLTNELLNSKIYNRRLFQTLQLPVAMGLVNSECNLQDFYQQFTKTILEHKSCSKWVLKLPDSQFSRGLAVFQTDSLKIIKQAKKHAVARTQDIKQISNLLQDILAQKINLAQPSLFSGQEFMEKFKQAGHIQMYLQNYSCLGIFGRIQTNGLFNLLGSYRKISTQMVCFGAVYPANNLSSSLLTNIRKICTNLYQRGVFGYLTIQLMLDTKTQAHYFTDITPNIQNYSSLYFYYKRLLDISELDAGSLTLSKNIFYCPFIDNNATKCQSWAEFDSLFSNKLRYNQQTGEGIVWMKVCELPDSLGLLCIGNEVLKMGLDGLLWLVEVGGQFNKFDKKYKVSQSDGLYIMDVIWRLRQLKKAAG